MDVSTLKNQIKTGEFDKFYIFTGPERKIAELYLEKMSNASGFPIKKLDSITDLTKNLHNRSMLSGRSILMIYDSKEFLSNEELHKLITQSQSNQENIIIFFYVTIDKRSKMYRTFKDNLVEFDYLKPSVLTRYIQRDINLNDSNCQHLISICEQSYSRICNEIEKINLYCQANSTDSNMSADRAFKYLVGEGAINTPPYDAIFDFVGAVLGATPKRAFDLLDQTYKFGNSTLSILSNLYNNSKYLLQVQSYRGDSKITDATGLTPFQIKIVSQYKGIYSNGELVYLMRLIRDAEKGIKTGQIEDAMAVPYVLVNFW